MAIWNPVGTRLGRKSDLPVTAQTVTVQSSKEAKADSTDTETARDNVNETVPIEVLPRGVSNMQAVTMTWTKTSLATALILIWLLFLVNGFRIAILASLSPYVTSSFQSHSLLTVIYIVSDAMSAAIYIPMAKMLDVWGRAEGFLLMIGFSTLGLILMAVSTNLATFCAAQVFYSVGFGGTIYTICVLAADVTNLRNRGLAFAFTSSPYMITAFAGSKAAAGFLFNVKWQWGFGAFAIVLPIVTFPLFLLLKLNLRKAQKAGLLIRERSGRKFLESFWKGLRDFDVLGVVLFASGFTVFLLPFTLATSAPNGWKSDYIIAMIIVGFVVLVIFGLYEIYLAPTPFLQKKFLLDRTIIGACLIDMTYQMSYYCWASYFTSFLQIVCNLTVAEAGYVNSTFSVVSGVLLFIVGYAIRRTGRMKWLLYFAVPLYVFGMGLMIYFRRPNVNIGYIVMCEILISIGGAVFTLFVQLAVLAAVDYEYISAALATLFVAATAGGAIGNTISGTIWTNTFAGALARYLPESAQSDIVTIYSSLTVQLSYPVGSPERLAIQQAYGYAQTRMLAAGVGIMSLSFIWIFLVKDLNVKRLTQTKGVVF